MTQSSHSYAAVRVSALISLQVFIGSSRRSCVKSMFSVSLLVSSVHLPDKPKIHRGSARAMIHVHSLDLKKSYSIVEHIEKYQADQDGRKGDGGASVDAKKRSCPESNRGCRKILR